MTEKISKTKKNISLFLSSEEGKMINSDIVKLGVSLGVLGAGMNADVSMAANAAGHTNSWSATSHSSHANHASHASHGSHGSHGSHSSHSSHSSHGSHGSHGSHARGGWC